MAKRILITGINIKGGTKTKTHFVDNLTSGRKFRSVTAMLKKNAIFLSDKEYGRALSALVVACVDVALMCDNKLLLGLRVNEPWKDGWSFPGGRMKPGESFGDTAVRHVQADVGLHMNPKRFRVVRTNSWAWSRRAQAPQRAGCHTTSTVVFAELSSDEAKEIKPKGDLAEIQWMSIQKILRNRRIHPAHQQAARNIFTGQFQN